MSPALPTNYPMTLLPTYAVEFPKLHKGYSSLRVTLSHFMDLLLCKFVLAMAFALFSNSMARMINILLVSYPFKVFNSVVSWVKVNVINLTFWRRLGYKSYRDQSMNQGQNLSSISTKLHTAMPIFTFGWFKDNVGLIPFWLYTKTHNISKTRNSVERFKAVNWLPHFCHINSCKLPVVRSMATDTGKRLSGATLAMQGEL